MFVTRHLILSFLIFSCHGQEDNILFKDVISSGILKFATHKAGEIFVNALNAVANVPIEFARAIQGSFEFPALITHKNVMNLTDKFVTEFKSQQENEDAVLNISQLIAKYGYPVEKHNVQTEDGFILCLYRIPNNGRRIPNNGSVVFLMHGLLGSADDFVIAGPESGLAYLLANDGYDVWMGNARGNKHSRRHIEFNPSESNFWDFSWHHIGYYDLPAMIDYALHTSQSETLKYIGHSQGTTAFFVMAAERPIYNDKIDLMVALSPVAFMQHAKSPIVRLLAPGGPLIHSVTKAVGIHEFLPDNRMLRSLKNLMCSVGNLAEILCNNLVFMVAGFDLEQINATNLPVMLGHMPSGASAKQFAHYGQSVISGDFRQFDYGRRINLQEYGTETPPKYQLDRISAPVSLFYSESDWLAHPADVDKLYNELGNAIDIHKVPFAEFNHLDFLFAKDFKTFIYKRLLKLLSYF